MAHIPSKHSRQESITTTRPTKFLRDDPSGLDVDCVIVLDDSDDKNGEVTFVDKVTDPREASSRPLDKTGFSSHLKYALHLFGQEKNAPKRRFERTVIATETPENVEQHIRVKSKWSDGHLNVFFERSIPLPSQIAQYSHISVATTDVKLSDVASRICECLGLEDFFSIEFALYKIDSNEILTASPSTYQSPIRGDTLISEILNDVDEVAMRVRLREYITVASAGSDPVFAITPDSNCTLGQIRDMAALVWSKEAESMRLSVDKLELDDDTIPLVAWGLSHMSQISCVVETRECDICADDVGHLAWPSRTTSTCTHEPHNCKGCIRNWIASRLDNNAWKQITCLEDGCEEIYQAVDIQLHATPEENERYLRLSIRAGLAEDPNFHWCIGPQCESGQIHDPSGGDIFSCAACGYRSCSKCERPWHHEETCAQYTTRLDAVDGNEAASAAFIASNTKECPSCTSKIQKDGGCDHMTCRKCRNQFCWICSADYKDIHRQGNTAHASGCQYHSGNIPDPHAPVGVGIVVGRGVGGRVPRYQGENGLDAGAHALAPMPDLPADWQAPMALPAGALIPPGIFVPAAQQPEAQLNPFGYLDQHVNQWLAGMNNGPQFLGGDVDAVFDPLGANNLAQQAVNAARQQARNEAAQAHQIRLQAFEQFQAARQGQIQQAQIQAQQAREQAQIQAQQAREQAQIQAQQAREQALVQAQQAREQALVHARQAQLQAQQAREQALVHAQQAHAQQAHAQQLHLQAQHALQHAQQAQMQRLQALEQASQAWMQDLEARRQAREQAMARINDRRLG